MYKSRLLPISLLAIVCLVAPFISGKLLSATTSAAPTITALSPNDFITAVDNNDATVQKSLQTKISQLLGSPPPTGQSSSTSSNDATIPDPSQTQTNPSTTNSSSPTVSPSTSKSTGYNMY